MTAHLSESIEDRLEVIEEKLDIILSGLQSLVEVDQSCFCMIQAKSKATLKPLDPRIKSGRRLLEDFFFEDIRIPSGYDWDGATIPRLFWSLIGGPFHPNVEAASLVHDWLYFTRLKPRKEADKILLEICQKNKCSLPKSRLIYRAVSWFGWLFYRRTKSDKQYAKLLADYITATGRDTETYKFKEAFDL